MTLVRALVWLVVVAAFLMPPVMPPVMAQSAHALPMQAGKLAVHCPDHIPPPAPCPDRDSAKHAAGTCCSLMAAVVALLPEAVAATRSTMLASERAAAVVASLTGISHTKDPPPPRV